MSGRAATRTGVPRTQVQEQIDPQAALDSLDRTIAMGVEVEQGMAHTLEVLEAQGEQLTRVERTNERIERNLEIADKNVGILSSWFGSLYRVASGPIAYMRGTPPEEPQAQRKAARPASVTPVMDERLSRLSGLAGRMTDMGQRIGDKLDEHNDQIERIGVSVDVNAAKMKRVNRRMDDLLE